MQQRTTHDRAPAVEAPQGAVANGTRALLDPGSNQQQAAARLQDAGPSGGSFGDNATWMNSASFLGQQMRGPANYTGPAFSSLDPNRLALTFFKGNQSQKVLETWAASKAGAPGGEALMEAMKQASATDPSILNRMMRALGIMAPEAPASVGTAQLGDLTVDLIGLSGKPGQFGEAVGGAMSQVTGTGAGTVVSLGEQLQSGGPAMLEAVGHPTRGLATSKPEIVLDAFADLTKETIGAAGNSAGLLADAEKTIAPGYDVAQVARSSGAGVATDAGHSACNKIFSNVLEAGNDNAAFLHVQPERAAGISTGAKASDQAKVLDGVVDELTARAATPGRAPTPQGAPGAKPGGALSTLGRITEKGLKLLGVLGGGLTRPSSGSPTDSSTCTPRSSPGAAPTRPPRLPLNPHRPPT